MTEETARRIGRFQNPVCIQHDSIAGLELMDSRRVRCVRKCGKHQAVLFDTRDLPTRGRAIRAGAPPPTSGINALLPHLRPPRVTEDDSL